jgi:hypothetical protein
VSCNVLNLFAKGTKLLGEDIVFLVYKYLGRAVSHGHICNAHLVIFHSGRLFSVIWLFSPCPCFGSGISPGSAAGKDCEDHEYRQKKCQFFLH